MYTYGELMEWLRALKGRVENHSVTIDEVYDELERLTFSIPDPVPRERDDLRRALVNDVELIRFTELPDTQYNAVRGVLERAERLLLEWRSADSGD